MVINQPTRVVPFVPIVTTYQVGWKRRLEAKAPPPASEVPKKNLGGLISVHRDVLGMARRDRRFLRTLPGKGGGDFGMSFLEAGFKGNPKEASCDRYLQTPKFSSHSWEVFSAESLDTEWAASSSTAVNPSTVSGNSSDCPGTSA